MGKVNLGMLEMNIVDADHSRVVMDNNTRRYMLECRNDLNERRRKLFSDLCDLVYESAGKERVRDVFAAYLFTFGSAQRPHEFLAVCSEFDSRPRFVWEHFHYFWNSFDAIPHYKFAKLLRSIRSDWRADHIDDLKDRDFYDELPEEIIAFRGQDRCAPLGLSWTVDKEVAETFAQGHRGIRNKSPIIIAAHIKKKNVAGAYVSRFETELVLFDPRHATRRQSEELGVSGNDIRSRSTDRARWRLSS
ncbi:hypothetical protein [Methylocystis sp. ATCC 49242]|uniref:hypothetical protein n=1 Tax=Methylocystis sp. ATCC 49242 TaxID=622637 RepID=UPI001184A964|nr:hypothetical protein [Methylocystis sp. ATCC 49242]